MLFRIVYCAVHFSSALRRLLGANLQEKNSYNLTNSQRSPVAPSKGDPLPEAPKNLASSNPPSVKAKMMMMMSMQNKSIKTE